MAGSGVKTQPEPPQNLVAEEHVLGAMMLTARAIDECMEECSSGDFYRETHGRIFEAILAIHSKFEPVDAITVVDELDKRGQLTDIGGADRIREIATLVPAAGNARHHARLVRETAVLRKMTVVGREIYGLGMERGAETPDLVEKAERLVFDLLAEQQRSEFVTLGSGLHKMVDELGELHASGKEVIGLPTGFDPLDELTSGLQPGNLIVVAGRPSMGKTALALCLASNVTVRSEIPCALFTLEMSQAEVRQRVVSSEASIESQKLRNGRLNKEEWGRIMHTASALEHVPFLIDDSRTLTIGEIRSKCRRLKLQHPNLGLVIVDYLQLMASGPVSDRVAEIGLISRSLKILAGELEIPVIAISQLSRNPESRHDHRPILSDLRESGAIEQDSDIVAFVYRDEYYHPEDTDQEGIAEVNLAKHRNGATGTVKLAFVKRYARFSNLPRGTT